MKNYVFFILTFLIISIQCSYKIWDKDEFFTMVRNDKFGQNFYKEVIDNLKIILNYYSFIEIMKNPPQPSFDPNYFPKVDTIQYLEKMENEITDDTNSYDFYRDLKILIDGYRDAHMSYGFKGFNYQKYAFLCPIILTTKIDSKNETYVTAEMAFDESYFRNGTEIAKVIEKNKNKKIKFVNGSTPFEFMQTFGNPFMQLKNTHATYTFKYHQYTSPFALYFPLNSEDISNFTVEYENGDKFETDFAVAEIISDEKSVNNHHYNSFFNNQNEEKEFMKFLENKFDESYGSPKGLMELINEFEKNKKIKNTNNLIQKRKYNFEFEKFLAENEDIKWDYEYINGKGVALFQCRVDKENEINVYHIQSFSYDDLDLAFDTLDNCIALFDTNEYNIIVILNYNGGGSEIFSQTIVEYLQPYISSRFYSTFRQGEYLSKYYDINFKDHSIRETCKIPDKNYVLKNTEIIDYGNNVTNNITFPLTRFGQYRNNFNTKKKDIKNKRKPTEILVFTDSYSASAASLFCKSLQNEGGAIIAGYNGNPKSDKKFDSSQHFSTIITWNDLQILEEEATKKLDDLGVKFSQICITNNYLNYNELKVPEEFNVMPVDEVTNIYESFDTDKNYDLFIKTGKKILEKYKNECNNNNNKLTLFNQNCKFSQDKYAHGGYGCGNDGKWDTNKCIPIYCDNGYFFDNVENKCVLDPCLDHGNHSSFIKNINLVFLILGLIFML